MNADSPDELDRILSQSETIVPSSGFTARVMEAVEQEALAPPPIAFPWKRAVPGLVACLVLLGILLGKVAATWGPQARSAADWPATVSLSTGIQHISGGSGATALTISLVLVLFLSLVTMWLSLRIAGVRH